MKAPHIRLAREEDIQAILDIYAPHIIDSHHSFEIEVPKLVDFRERVFSTLETHPWLVYIWEEQVAGYAYAGPHRSRSSYQWTTESSVYVHPAYHRKGIAKALYEALIELLELQGFVNMYAIIALPNEASIRFHERMGFQPIGICQQVGFKRGQWIDTSWWQYVIHQRPSNPTPPIPFQKLAIDHTNWKKGG